jgi:hypothetical protein
MFWAILIRGTDDLDRSHQAGMAFFIVNSHLIDIVSR